MKPEKSLEIIQSMMAEAKQSFHKVSPYFLIWGVLLVISGIAEHVIVYQMGLKQGYAVWGIMGVLGGVISMWYSRKESKKQKVKTYYDLSHNYLWGGFGITLFLVILLSVWNRQNPTPYVLLLTGLPTFVTGGIAKFNPLKVGGIVFWVAGILSFFVAKEFTGLVFSGAIFLGYLIPGYLLYKQESGGNA
ncbi:MAG: hypothetical protein CL840_19745 [Crocinitomicaceae bacterium]|nr:hypothetical protein [Crocinitomicaceae bacterium]|tara:strand:+ start:840 stop:1409 length:570 start_codon:yes stop_codon:yes gene_type:complete